MLRIALVLLAISVLHAGTVIFERNLASTLLAVDATGNAYVASTNNLITKLGPDGRTLYSKTLPLPGTWSALTVDRAGNVVIVGTTSEDTLPTTPNVFQPARQPLGVCIGFKTSRVSCPDAFVAKLDSTGNLLWATYLGGSTEEQANAVAIDPSGNIFVAGLTRSADFPTTGSFQRAPGGSAAAFVAKISPDGSRLLYSNCFGGSDNDVANAIAVDSAGNAFVAGVVGSAFTPTAGNFGNGCGFAGAGATAFLMKIAPGGDRVIFAGCLGGQKSYSSGTAVAVDPLGNVYLGGLTGARELPVTPGAFDGRSTGVIEADFLAEISPDGSKLLYLSQFDGAPFGIYSLAVDSGGAVYAAGQTRSPSLSVIGLALQPCPGPARLSYNFLLEMNAAGSAVTYFSYEVPDQNRISLGLAADGTLYEAAGLVRRIANLDRAGAPYLSSLCVMNGASLRSHIESGQPGISPGEIVTLKGTGLGPEAGVSAAGSTVGSLLGETQVVFDGVPAPLLYVQDRQINVVAPYSLAGKTQTSIEVHHQNGVTQTVTVPVSPSSLAVFQDFATGAPLVFNQDFSLNSGANPAARGTVVVLFVTGGGQTSPASVDGQVWQGPGGLEAGVSAELEHLSTPRAAMAVNYAGPVPGVVAGVQQLNLLIPADLPPAFLSGVTGNNNYMSVTVAGSTVTVPVVVR